MMIYLNKHGKLLKASDFGDFEDLGISNFHFSRETVTVLAAVPFNHLHSVDLYILNEDGTISRFDIGSIMSTDYFAEAYGFEKLDMERYGLKIQVEWATVKAYFEEETMNIQIVQPGEIQSREGTVLYRHPKFDLIIQKEGNTTFATDIRSRVSYPFNGDIVHYDSDSTSLYVINEGNLMRYDGLGNVTDYGKAVLGGISHEYCVIPSGNGYRLLDFHMDTYHDPVLADIHSISNQKYSSVLWDGRYFVLLDPLTGHAVYWDPEKPLDPEYTLVNFIDDPDSKISPLLAEGTPWLTKKPADAPSDFEIVMEPDGSFRIDPYVTGIQPTDPDPLLTIQASRNMGTVRRWSRIERVNDTTFIGYDSSEKPTLIRMKSNGKPVLFDDFTTIEDFSDQIVIVSDWYHGDKIYSKVFDLRTDPNTPPAIYHFPDTLSLSASGEHLIIGKTNRIIEKRTDIPNEVVHVEDKSFIQEYRLHEIADVLLLKDRKGKYSLKSFRGHYKVRSPTLGECLILEADHIEIDSSGKIAIAKFGDELKVYDLVSGDLLFPLGALPTEIIHSAKVASDENFIYVSFNNSTNLQVFSKSHGKWTSPILATTAIDDIPLVWEDYDLKRKTLWYRNAHSWFGIVASESIPYRENPPTQEPTLGYTLLFSNVISYENLPNSQFPSYMVSGQKSGVDAPIKEITDSDPLFRYLPMKGGKVFYTSNKFRNAALSGFIFNSESFFETLVRDPEHRRTLFVNRNGTHILSEEMRVDHPKFLTVYAYAYFLTDSQGKRKDVSNLIPPGFVPTDVNGDYFVFHNPQTLETGYLDPNAVLPIPDQDPQDLTGSGDPADPRTVKSLEIWNETFPVRKNNSGQNLRKQFIAQALSFLKPYLSPVTEEAQSEDQQDVRARIQKLILGSGVQQAVLPQIRALISNQNREIGERFLAVIGSYGDRILDESDLAAEDFLSQITQPNLPFDQFAEKMKPILATLPQYLESLEKDPEWVKEKIPFKQKFYRNLFIHLFETVSNPAISIPKEPDAKFEGSDAKFYENLYLLIGLGAQIGNQESLVHLDTLLRFVRALQSQDAPTPLSKILAILSFLSSEESKDPKKQKVVPAQIEKLLAIPDYVSLFASAIRGLEEDDLELYSQDQVTRHLGETWILISFLLHESEPVRDTGVTREEMMPRGIRTPLPSDGISIAQLMSWERSRPKRPQSLSESESDTDRVMSSGYFLARAREVMQGIRNLPLLNIKSVEKILNMARGRSTGTDTTEIAQNSKHGCLQNPQGELVIRFYLQIGLDGKKEFVKESRDNGTGTQPSQELALLLPRSLKRKGDSTSLGRFGTGKYAMYQGEDRLEFISNNGESSVFMVVEILKNDAGEPIDLRLVDRWDVDREDDRFPRGVTVRQIKKADKTIPGLEMALSRYAWKRNTGLSQNDQFKIYIENYEGAREPLQVDDTILNEVELETPKIGGEEGETVKGIWRVYNTPDFPGRVVNEAGLTVSAMKDEYLGLIAPSLRPLFRELGITLQIPFGQTDGRTDFEFEDDYLPLIKKMVAIGFYRALAFKVRSQKGVPYIFGNLPSDFRTNPHRYHDTFTDLDFRIPRLAERINPDSRAGEIQYDQIRNEELESLFQGGDSLDLRSDVLKLILLLRVPLTDWNEDRIYWRSLMDERTEMLKNVDQSKGKRQSDVMEGIGYLPMPTNLGRDARYPGWLEEAQRSQKADEITRHDFTVVEGRAISDAEKEFLKLAYDILKPIKLQMKVRGEEGDDGESEDEILEFGIDGMGLVTGPMESPIHLAIVGGRRIAFIHRSLLPKMGEPDPESKSLDIYTSTILEWGEQILLKGIEFEEDQAYNSRQDLDALWQRGIFPRKPTVLGRDSQGLGAGAQQVLAWMSMIASDRSSALLSVGLPVLVLNLPLLVPEAALLPPSFFSLLLILSIVIPVMIANLAARRVNPIQDTETSSLLTNILKFAKISGSPIYKRSLNRTREFLRKETDHSQPRIILIEIDPRFFGKNAQGNYRPDRLKEILLGVGKGIEETKTENGPPTYLKFVLEDASKEGELRSLIKETNLEEYVLADFAARTSQDALRETQGFEILFVLADDPKNWPQNLIVLSLQEILRPKHAAPLNIQEFWRSALAYLVQA
ncbi:MAG: hypothetical protein HYY07_03150 [Elusimicrobia bacterium]|nr:hypothetical protein [Elusimicrobiota bacterium]